MSDSIAEKCTGCGACSTSCSFLSETDESPAEMAQRDITAHEAYSCSLCGLCSSVCPLGLNPMGMFAQRRRDAVNKNEIDINEYRYMFPDRPNNLMNTFRRHFGIDYSDIASFEKIESCFFPGCTLMSYSPGLTREIFKRLASTGDCQGMWTECCGKPLDQLGLQQRLSSAHASLKEFVEKHAIKRIISACPGCYYELRKIFSPDEVEIQTVYEALKLENRTDNAGSLYTVHDSCPDRIEGIFGEQVRQALAKANRTVVEMSHSREQTICCGSGGQQSHFRADLTEEIIQRRREEVQNSGADTLVGYCLSCVLKYESKMPDISVVHALNLLLELEPDYQGAKERAASMLSGPDGEKIWEEIMDDN